MKIQFLLLIILQSFSSLIIHAQALPDEINYPKYESIKNEDARILEADLKFYNDTVVAKIATEEQLRSTHNEIQRLQSSLSQVRQELNQRIQQQQQFDINIRQTQNLLQRENQDLQRELSLFERLEREYQQIVRIHQPINNRYEQQRERLIQEQQLNARLEKNVLEFTQEVEQLEHRMGTLPSDIAKAKVKINKFEDALAELKKELEELSNKITAIKQKINGNDEKLTAIKQQAAEINKEIAILKREIENARRMNTDPSKIQAMEEALAKKQITKAEIDAEKDRLETLLAPLQDQLTKVEAEKTIAQNRTNNTQRELNSETKQLEKMIAEESQIAGQLQKARQDLTRASAAHRIAEQNVSSYQREFSTTEREWREATQLLAAKQREIEIQQQRVSSMEHRRNTLEQELNDLILSANQNTSAINTLNSQVISSEASLSQNLNTLSTLKTNLATLHKQEVEGLARANQSQERFNASNAQYEQRLNLYSRYENAAIQLGADEVGSTASSQGDKEGSKIAVSIASRLGQEIGADLGAAQGTFWANVRGEAQGYSLGYANGRKAPIDLERAKLEGGKKGEEAAVQYLEKVLRPKYFVEYLDELIAKSEVAVGIESQLPGLATSHNKLAQQKFLSPQNTTIKAHQDPQPLTEEELEISQKISSSLDQLIMQGEKEVQSLVQKSQEFENYRQAYVTPSEIPLGKAKCIGVYKDLAIFKSLCHNSYKNTFKNEYLNSHASAFKQIYTVDYKNNLQQKQVLNRANSYQRTFSGSYSLAESEGFKIGTEESYQEAVKEHYDVAYEETLRIGDAALRLKITEEVKAHVEKNATLGLVSVNLDQTIFLPGSLGKMKILVKNISPQIFQGSAFLKITKAENVLLTSQTSVLQSVAALSQGSFPAIDYKISPTAKAGTTLLIEGTIDFPGDPIRSVRTQRFQIKKILGKNLVPELKFNYDETPKVRYIFGYKKHTIKVYLTPKYEAATQGYRVALTPSADSAEFISFKTQESMTKALNVGQSSKVKLSYKLTRPAKGKILTMTCDIYSEGVLIEQKLIRLQVK